MQIHSTTSAIIPQPSVAEPGATPPEQQDDHREVAKEDGKRSNHPSPNDLDQAQLQQIDKLRQRDREVRNHEMAHLAAAGAYALGGPTFEYQKGPDGQRYAIGGHVNIDTSPVAGDPEATQRKAETIRRAALAPGDPSPQDRSVAAAASAMAVKAQIEAQQSGQNATSGTESRSRNSENASDLYPVDLSDETSRYKLDLFA